MWRVEKTLAFTKELVYGEGYAHLGFHGSTGEQFVLAHWANWVAALDAKGKLAWSAGPIKVPESPLHIRLGLASPMFLAGSSVGGVYVSCYGDRGIYRLEPDRARGSLFIDGAGLGMRDMGNCILDAEGFLWANEVEGCRIWRFDPTGSPIERIGTEGGRDRLRRGLPAVMSFDDAAFGWIADIRLGPEGTIYILDSGFLAVWKADPAARSIRRIAGSGAAGRSGDGGDALFASFGSDSSRRFGGPLSLSIDESQNVYVGDSVNGLVRMIDSSDGTIRTIADGFSDICSMDYWKGRLFVPEGGGRLSVLERVPAFGGNDL